MSSTPERFLAPDILFQTVEGMNDIDRLLRAVGRESARQILQPNTIGAAVMNGSIIPLAYAAAAAQACGQFDHFAKHLVFFGSSKDEEEVTLHPDKSFDDQTIIVIEDIADRLGVLTAFERQYPQSQIRLFAPVQKPHTRKLHDDSESKRSNIHTVTTVPNVWVSSGCGMDEGLTYPEIPPSRQDYLTVLQRCSRIGVCTQGARTFEQRIAFFEQQLLPWISPEDSLFDMMIRMEEAKRTNNPDNVLRIVPEIMPTIHNLLSTNPFLE